MTTEPDRAQVLKMIETGQVNAADGARLLSALGQPAPSADLPDRWLRLRITDLDTQRPKVSVNLPMTWVALGLKLGSHYKPELAQIDVNEIVESVRRGAEGRLVEVENIEDGERIEIFVD
jgi:hypothetical protein